MPVVEGIKTHSIKLSTNVSDKQCMYSVRVRLSVGRILFGLWSTTDCSPTISYCNSILFRLTVHHAVPQPIIK